ncbi:hypothetical protein EGI26_20975 [Lacihabitans sp. CCS-44]|uniref:hypothetical protein n=1 Tax=Lacihabitans sp. CCS-44 TaxID=2487331 RepID=UPI0020CC8A0A|nr:hypothetical protein [Lacihabitans sp. CCS-44]MCP9757644.1 hypothetical protein [Lacihabitans sp. CCS-44]
MQISHVISDLILAATGLYVFFVYLSRLNLTSTVLWESFVLSVTAAAIFGAITFAGFPDANPISLFFQKLATITGGVGLVGATFALISGKDLNKISCYSLLTLGFFLFVLSEGFGISQVGAWVPIVAMSLVVVLAILGFSMGKSIISVWLLVGVAFFAIGTFRAQIFGKEDITIDIFHYLTAGGLLSLGMANSKKSA